MVDILIIEDNLEIGSMLKDFLIAENYTVQHFLNGEEGLEYYEAYGCKLLILDIILEKMNGYEVCEKIREKDNVPILIITAKITKQDKIKGITLGADDYIEKPYDIDILLAKIDGIFKRKYQMDILNDGNILINKATRKVEIDNSEILLSAKEYELLLFFLENKSVVLNKELIFNRIWGFDSFSELQTLTVHIKWLRSKIEMDPKNPKRIVTIWGVGYRFE